jgi:hypothetical protein
MKSQHLEAVPRRATEIPILPLGLRTRRVSSTSGHQCSAARTEADWGSKAMMIARGAEAPYFGGCNPAELAQSSMWEAVSV